VRIASNIGLSGGGIEYTLFQAPLVGHDFLAQRIDWGVQIKGSPLDLIGGQKSQRSAAVEFLEEFLRDGSQAQQDVKEAAEAHGHAWATVRRAKSQLRIKPQKTGRTWCWALPEKPTWRDHVPDR